VSPRILVVEDESAIRLALRGLLRKDGHDVELAESGDAALHMLEREAYDLILTDLALGRGPSGMDVLRASRAARPETAVVMITAHGNEKLAVEAMKSGAQDYVPKPFDNDELRLVVQRALERTRLERENRQLLERVEREYGFGNLIGAGPAMRRVFETIQKVAATDLSVLVLGESGTGKELVAQALHQQSARRAKPFIAVNCAAISPELVESELFGHEKGSFTGADARRTGKFEAAHGGTIFLDEIGDMARETQAKVLRVLQERELERVGGSERIRVDVRVVAATHRDLEQEVERGRFREDLYYRLKVVELRIPPLRERVEDIPALAARFLDQLAERLKRPRAQLEPEALAALVRHPWRGNVRELRNVIEQAAVLCAGERIAPDDLRLAPPPGDAVAHDAAPGAELPFREAKRRATESFERTYLIRALREHGGNISRTAESLGMVRQSLQQKIRELSLTQADWDVESHDSARDGAESLRTARRRSEP
jgi:DNA-binding NtrC family response regulator